MKTIIYTVDAIIVAAKIIIVSNNVEQNMDGMDTKG